MSVASPQDYVVFLALKQNTNIYNLKAAAALNVDVTDDSYMSAPADCMYANSTQKAGARRLLNMDMGSDTVGCVFDWNMTKNRGFLHVPPHDACRQKACILWGILWILSRTLSDCTGWSLRMARMDSHRRPTAVLVRLAWPMRTRPTMMQASLASREFSAPASVLLC